MFIFQPQLSCAAGEFAYCATQYVQVCQAIHHLDDLSETVMKSMTN